MFIIIDTTIDDNLDTNWDEIGTPPSNIYLEDSKGQCIAQVLCSNKEEQFKISRLLAASTDMKTLLESISTMTRADDYSSLKYRIQPILNYINGELK